MLRIFWIFVGLLFVAGCGRLEISIPRRTDDASQAVPNSVAPEEHASGSQLLAQAIPVAPGAAPATLKPPAAIDGAPAPAITVTVPAAPGAVMVRPGIFEWTEKDVALDSLGRIGPAAVPALTEALAHPDAKVRREAARALSFIGPEAKDAVPSLILATKDEDAGVRFLAIRALGQIGPGAKDAVPTLIRAIQ